MNLESGEPQLIQNHKQNCLREHPIIVEQSCIEDNNISNSYDYVNVAGKVTMNRIFK